jgi:ribosome biogenesis protein ERB1
MKRTAFEAIDGLIEADNQEMHSDNIEEVIDSDDNDIEGLIDSDNQNIDEQMFENEEGSIDSDNDSAFDDWEKNQLMVYRKRHFNPIVPDYSSETSDEETNTLGNIPLEWYDDYPHIGYNVEGKKIMKPAQGDDLDKFLALMDKEEWKSVHVNGQKFTLNQEQLEILKRIQNRQFPHLDFDPYQPTVEWFTSKTEVMPLSAAPEPKRRFVPSQWEAQKIMKIARAIKDGLILPKKPEPKTKEFYDLWSSANDVVLKDRIKAPKLALPKTEESYNPPEEYLLDKNEEQSWLDTDPSDRKTNFLPKKYPALRKVPGYNKFIEERFERCLDLYLCPRIVRQRVKYINLV